MASAGPAHGTPEGTASDPGTDGGTDGGPDGVHRRRDRWWSRRWDRSAHDRADSPHGRDAPDLTVQVLFVCTANRARSPFAAAVTERRVIEQALPVEVLSAGLQAFEGEPAIEPMERQASKFDTDLTDHLSTPVTAELLERTDLVFTMTGRQIVGLVDAFPTDRSRTITLREWARHSVDGDPITDWTRDTTRLTRRGRRHGVSARGSRRSGPAPARSR